MSPVELDAAEQLQRIEASKKLLGTAVHTKLVQGGEGGLTNAIVRRFLVSRNWDVKAACKLLTAHADWRAEFVPRGFIAEDEIASELAMNKYSFQGFDKGNRPVVVVTLKNHNAYKRDLEALKKAIVWAMDYLTWQSDRNLETTGGYITVLYDLQGYTMANSDVTGSIAMLKIVHDQYPERLYRAFLYEAPTMFWALWKAIYPFMDTATRQKVSFVYGSKGRDEMLQHIPEDVLPESMGGKAPLQRAQDVKLKVAGSDKPYFNISVDAQ